MPEEEKKKKDEVLEGSEPENSTETTIQEHGAEDKATHEEAAVDADENGVEGDDVPVEVEVEEGESASIAEDEKDIPEVEDAKKPEEVARLSEIPFNVEAWQPKTEVGKRVKSGDITDLGDILCSGVKVLEPQIVDILLPRIENDLLLIGQAKGKFGGGQRRVFKQCQKKTREGNKPSFATAAVIGNKNGFVGLGYGKARETVPAREKAIRDAKRNVIMIKRGSGSWEGAGDYPNSIPFKVSGKCGSVAVDLIPAPNGTGLCIESECAKILKLAGIHDVWSKTRGQAKTKINQIKACFEALKKLSSTKVRAEEAERANIVTGKIVDNR
ncbi:MAG: 30S ribosomal protein S5 [Candidatus Woesearchaeota archaeon]